MVSRDLIGSLGHVVASIGSQAFAVRMYDLLSHGVSCDLVHISEWIVDQANADIVAMHNLGGHGLCEKTRDGLDLLCGGDPRDKTVAHQVIELGETQIILNNMSAAAPQSQAKDPTAASRVELYQCSLASRREDRRYVISLYRTAAALAFSLGEMSVLRDYSELLLRIVEKHAACVTSRAHAEDHSAPPVGADGNDRLQISALREIFTQRVECSGVALSLREREVCLALLMGHTVAEIASQLCVRSSTVETYTKRAAIKLGVSGRHGLTRWMVGVPTCLAGTDARAHGQWSGKVANQTYRAATFRSGARRGGFSDGPDRSQ